MFAVSSAFSRVRTTSSWCATSPITRGRLGRSRSAVGKRAKATRTGGQSGADLSRGEAREGPSRDRAETREVRAAERRGKETRTRGDALFLDPRDARGGHGRHLPSRARWARGGSADRSSRDGAFELLAHRERTCNKTWHWALAAPDSWSGVTSEEMLALSLISTRCARRRRWRRMVISRARAC